MDNKGGTNKDNLIRTNPPDMQKDSNLPLNEQNASFRRYEELSRLKRWKTDFSSRYKREKIPDLQKGIMQVTGVKCLISSSRLRLCPLPST